MVGGRIIEKLAVSPGNTRLWCVDGQDECAVIVKNAELMPDLGEAIWWQGGKVFARDDRLVLEKVGFSFDPRASA